MKRLAMGKRVSLLIDECRSKREIGTYNEAFGYVPYDARENRRHAVDIIDRLTV